MYNYVNLIMYNYVHLILNPEGTEFKLWSMKVIDAI